MSIHLYKHNEDAYRAVETMLEEKQMAAVIHPTGTGKSMIAFKLVEQHAHNHFLWLSPSEYIYKTQLENIDTQFSNIEYMSYSRLMKHEDSIDTLRPDYIILDEFHRCRTDFADIQNKKECGGNRQWQNHYLRNWAANTKGKGII